MPTIHLPTPIPGPHSEAIIARRRAAISAGNAFLTPIAFASGDGVTLTDVDGNTYLDFAGGIGMQATGHCPPAVVQAIQQQAAALIHPCAIVGSYEPLVALAERLNELTPGDFPKKTTLSNSGAEAIEAAVKLARAHTGREAIVVFEGAYHGRTNLTMAMTSKYALFKKGFGPFAPEIYRLPFPNLYRRPDEMSAEGFVEYACRQLDNALIAQVDPAYIAAIVVEPVQGEGGFIPVPPRFFEQIRHICDTHGIVMVADEIQCGLSRTGRLFASEHYGVAPDLVASGKALGAGLPIAAVTGRADIMDAAHPGGLGGTYSGSPIACAAALAALDTLADPAFLARATHLGRRLRVELETLRMRHPDFVGDVRGLGPMLAMEIVRDPFSKEPDMATTAAINAATLRRGLITIRAGLYSNCVRFLPPLTLTDAQLDEALAVLGDALAEVAAAR